MIANDPSKQAILLFKNCGNGQVNGDNCNSYFDFMSKILAKNNFFPGDADRLLEDMRSLNVILETLRQGNQYVPDKELIGKCPRLMIDMRPTEDRPDGLPIHIGVEWY